MFTLTAPPDKYVDPSDLLIFSFFLKRGLIEATVPFSSVPHHRHVVPESLLQSKRDACKECFCHSIWIWDCKGGRSNEPVLGFSSTQTST